MLHNLGDIAKSKFHNSPIRIRAIVSGKSTAPYKIPLTVELQCVTPECCGGHCRFKNKKEIIIKPSDETFLLFIDIPSVKIGSAIRQYAKTPCKQILYKILSTQNVLRIFISQPTGEDRTKWLSAQTSYYVGHDITTNTTFYLEGFSTVDPKTQLTTYIFTNAEKSKTDIESFELTREAHKKLLQFCRSYESVDEVFSYLGQLYESYALNVTKIYDRFLLHLAVDIIFHSAMEFTLPSGRTQPARIDAIVIGDTRCGKGHVAEGLSKYYGVGEIVGAENCTFAGLVGGAQQIGNHWVISWGRIPLNDRGLVIIDEASELKDEDWTRLSRIRSEGIAEVTKIQQQVTNARTRLLFLSNPPSKAMSNYTFGIHSLQELVHAPEDIARFDYACIVSHEEVPIEKINRAYETTKYFYPQSLERELILWIWSRANHQIQFSNDAVKEIFETANRFGKFYDIGIPLIQGENIRFKIAKIATAFAGRLYSHEKNGEVLKVRRVHVKCAAAFLRGLYESDVNGYYDHSCQRKELNPKLQTENIDSIVAYFNAYKSQDEAFHYLLNNTYIQAKDVMEHLNISHDVAIEVIFKLIKFKCIVKKGQLYVKTPSFTKWLRTKMRRARKN